MNLKHNILAALLLCVGLAQMVGSVFDIAPLKGLAIGTAASPAPKVFTSIKGMETFSTGFTLSWLNEDGKTQRQIITHDIYPGLLGPYNRRNVWGAMLAYGPVLATDPVTEEMFNAVVKHGLCEDAPVLQELGIDPTQVNDLRITYDPRSGTQTALPLELKPECES